MFHNLSIRHRLTILSACLLTVCCVGLTIILNLSAFQLADQIDATIITTPAIQPSQEQLEQPMIQELLPSTPSQDTQEAKKGFSTQSILYMMVVILGGSSLMYYVTGKALQPLELLNKQVKDMTVHKLSQSLIIPPTKDEIAELTQSFNDMTDNLNDAFLAQKCFSASAAHELRTPLAVLQTKVDVFKKKNAHTTEEYDALIAVFEKQINRLRGLVANLLDMTNMEDDREKSTLILHDVFKDMIEELSPMAEHYHIQLALQCDDSNVYGNVDLLYRAFYNLIENGIRYNKKDGFVNIVVRKTTKQVEIQIIDSGIGIPEDQKKHIFEPFYRVDQSRSRELGGVGLGLAMVDRIIKNHGGTISVSDQVGGGTCFRILL